MRSPLMALMLVILSSTVAGIPAFAQTPTPPDAAICVKPDAPKFGDPGNDQSTINAYNARIQNYNRKSLAFSNCMNSFLERNNTEIQKTRDDSSARIKLVASNANSQTKDIDAKIAAAMAGTVLATGQQSGYPPSDCRRPDEALLKSIKGKSDIARTALYDAQKRAYQPCIHAYIEQARGEIQQVQENARTAISLIVEDANTHIRMLNAKVSDARSTADDATREGAQAAESLKGLTAVPGVTSEIAAYPRPPRSADTPKGNGDPDAIVCRAPQILPDSRLLGPEVCKRNREWAQLYHEGSDISADGLRLVDSELKRTRNATCAVGNAFCAP